MTVRDIRQPEEIPPVLAAIRAQHRLLRRGMAKARRAHGQKSGAGIALAAGEWRHVKRDGTGFDASITISSIQYEGREARLVMVTDVTARKQADESLRNLTAELERRVGERTAAARETMERLQATLVAANVVAWELDLASGRLLETGPVATFFGKPEGFLHGDDASFFESIHPDDRAGVRTHVERAIQRGCGSYAVEFRVVHPDGGIRWVATTGQVECDAAGRPVRLRGISQDITGRKQAESVLAKTHRALRVLTECGHELLRLSSEQDLLDTACRIAVDVGGYQMAWVGYAENDARKSIRPMALVGSAKDDLSRMHLTWADTKFGCGPTGEAIRTGQPCRCQDIAKDLMYAPWRADALKHGYASALALPLMSEQECLGALTICAAHREAFDEVEVSLLQQLANDLTVGIMSIRARAQRTVL
ncbi:MAG: GAF domain-containing protein, partial [bacterium]